MEALDGDILLSADESVDSVLGAYVAREVVSSQKRQTPNACPL